MSRIADVMEKARRAAAGGRRPVAAPRGDEPTLRSVGDVNIPWQLDEKPLLSAVAPVPTPAAAAAPRPVPPAVRKVVDLSPDAETVALARTLFFSVASERKRVLFSAADPSSSSAKVAVGLAVAIAREAAGSVCLIDLALNDGTLHEALDFDGTVGFSEVVVRGIPAAECLQQLRSEPALTFMALGSCALELRAALRDPATTASIRTIVAAFDYVVAHGTPGVVEDAVAFGACFDGVVLVLEKGTTTPQAARTAAAALQQAGVTLLGTIVNRGPSSGG